MPYTVRTKPHSANASQLRNECSTQAPVKEAPVKEAQDMAASSRSPRRARSARIELRTTDDQRDLIDRAAEMEGIDRTAFILRCSTEAAQRVLTDRDLFVLSAAQAEEWERINSLPAVGVEGLPALFDRPSPFV